MIFLACFYLITQNERFTLTFLVPRLTYQRGTNVLRPVRSSVRVFLRDRPLKLSEILYEVVTLDRLKSDIVQFLKKISLGP